MVFFTEKEKKNREILDLVYDIENFVVDLEYENGEEVCSPERQAYLGKLSLARIAYAENERKSIYSKIRPVLCDMGVREEVKGFRLLCSLVYHGTLCERAQTRFYLRDGYEDVAKEFGISSACCERLCRYACDSITFDKRFSLKYAALSYLTHRTYEKVTVKELVDALVGYVNIKIKPKNKTM